MMTKDVGLSQLSIPSCLADVTIAFPDRGTHLHSVPSLHRDCSHSAYASNDLFPVTAFSHTTRYILLLGGHCQYGFIACKWFEHKTRTVGIELHTLRSLNHGSHCLTIRPSNVIAWQCSLKKRIVTEI